MDVDEDEDGTHKSSTMGFKSILNRLTWTIWRIRAMLLQGLIKILLKKKAEIERMAP